MGLEIQVKKGSYARSNDPIKNFLKRLKNPETQRQYPSRLKYFMDSLYTIKDEDDPEKDTFRKLDEISLEEQVAEFMKHKDDLDWVKTAFLTMIEVTKRRVKAKKITDAPIMNYYKAAKKFCDANDIGTVSMWDAIREEIPVGRKSSNDRKPTLEEIKKLVSYNDKRIKGIVYTMLSSGIRLSSWYYRKNGEMYGLKWGDIEPYYDENKKVTCAKLRAFNIKRKNVHDEDKYYTTFITPEAFYELEKWIEFRKDNGEIITKDSWLMRDLFESTNKNGNNLGKVNEVKPLKSTGIKTMLERSARSAKLFKPLKEGVKRRDWKLAHGMRKWFKSMAESENSIKSLYIEVLLDHDIKIDESYHKPTDIELRNLYLKLVPLLTIEAANIPKDYLKMKEAITEELETKYQQREKELRKEMRKEMNLLNKLNDFVMQQLVPEAREKETFKGIYLSPEEQYNEFITNRKNITQEDKDLLKEMIDEGLIEAYEEESLESIKYREKFEDIFNKNLDVINIAAIELGRGYNYEFDKDNNLIIKFNKKLKRKDLKFDWNGNLIE